MKVQGETCPPRSSRPIANRRLSILGFQHVVRAVYSIMDPVSRRVRPDCQVPAFPPEPLVWQNARRTGVVSQVPISLWWSHNATVIGPVKQGLSLARSAPSIAHLTMSAELGNVAPHCPPAADLPIIFVRYPAALVVTTVPLEPTTRVIRMNPSLCSPGTEWLTCVNAKPV